MEMYYTVGDMKHSGHYVHFEIKDAYDNQMPTSEWINSHPADAALIEQINNALMFPTAISTQYITRYATLQGTINDILNVVKSFNIKLIQNDKLNTCLYIPSTLVVRQKPLDVYYDLDYDDDGCKMWFGFKNYEDQNISTYDAVMNANICNDYNTQQGCSQEYHDFLEILSAFGCCESQECVYELSIPFVTLKPFFKQYGYNMIEINQINVY